jgi:hypothetical protein
MRRIYYVQELWKLCRLLMYVCFEVRGFELKLWKGAL